MARNETPQVKQEIVFIEDLLQEIAEGKLRIPDFQRPYVWKPSDMLDLFDSIKKGYPIGSLLFWESSEPVESVNKIGPIDIPRPKDRSLTYILDGHQRMATLFACLRLPKEAPRGPRQEDWRWWVWFDLNDEIFAHLPKGHPPPSWIPLRSILRTVTFLDEARRIVDEAVSGSEALIKKAETLAQVVKNYKVAVTRINGGSLNQAVEIFSRLNTKGRSMTLDQMVSALTYREGASSFNLSRRIDGIIEGLSLFHFGSIKRITLFRTIVAAANKDVYNSNWESVAKELGPEIDQTVNAVERSLLEAARFLVEKLEVPFDGLLPYTNQLMMISEFFRLCPQPSFRQEQLLERWFWATSFSGWFAGANTTQIGNAIKEMRFLAQGNLTFFDVVPLDDAAQPFPLYFDMRSARVRCLILVLLRLKPRDPLTGEELQFTRVLRELGSESLVPIFRSAHRDLISNPANRLILDRNPGFSVRDRLRSIPAEIQHLVLESHGITEEAFEAFENDDANKFISLRAKTLAQIERNFMRGKDIRVPEELMSDDRPVDAEMPDPIE